MPFRIVNIVNILLYKHLEGMQVFQKCPKPKGAQLLPNKIRASYIYICILYIHIHICALLTYIYIYIHMCIYIHTRWRHCIRIYIYICIYIYMYTRMYVRVLNERRSSQLEKPPCSVILSKNCQLPDNIRID